MSNKLYSIIASISYISYLISVLPLIFLYYFLTNPAKRMRNQKRLRKVLKNGGIPKTLRKEIAGSYKEFTNLLSFRNVLKMRKNVNVDSSKKGFVNV